MGIFSGKNHEPNPARDPRPKGAQKGVVWRDHELTATSIFRGKTPRTPWVDSRKIKPPKPVGKGKK